MFFKNAGSVVVGRNSLLLSSSVSNRIFSRLHRLMTREISFCQCSLSSSTWRYNSKYPFHESIRGNEIRTGLSSVTTDLYAPATNELLRQYSTSLPTLHKDNNNDNDDDDDDYDSTPTSSSPFATTTTTTTKRNPHQQRKERSKFIPLKAAVQLSERARVLFQKLLASKPDKDGILLDYHQSSSGEPRMVFSFQFVTKNELVEEDEGYVCFVVIVVVIVGWFMDIH
jgi:hypothetical protein